MDYIDKEMMHYWLHNIFIFTFKSYICIGMNLSVSAPDMVIRELSEVKTPQKLLCVRKTWFATFFITERKKMLIFM